MSNEVSIRETENRPNAPLQQDGENNFNINNQMGGVVNLNYNVTAPFPQPYAGVSAEQMMVVRSFSRKYYQLLVTLEDDVFTNNVITISASRALSKHLVPSEIFERCSTLTDDGIDELKTFPAIICRENTDLKGETDPNQCAVYAYIKKVQVCGRDIKVAFKPIAPIQQRLLCMPKNAVYFDLNMDCAITDLNHSAWSVHKANLFEAFREAGIHNVPMPEEENRAYE